MTTVESLGYLKGLLDGLDLDSNKKETKVYKAIIDVLENLTEDIEDVHEDIDVLEEQIDEIDEDLADVEDYIMDEDDFCDCDCDCCDDEDDGVYELQCPACGADIEVDEDTIIEGGIECPSCGEFLEFEVEEDEEETEE